MKQILLTLIGLFTLTTLTAQQANKTLIKTINIEDAKLLKVDVDGMIKTASWDRENLIRVQMEITYENASVHVMKYLITKGRYNIKLEKPSLILQPNYTDKVQINKNGDLLIEKVTYTFFLPDDVELINLNEEQAALAENE